MEILNYNDLITNETESVWDQVSNQSCLVLNMPNETYHDLPGISNSGLTLVARSPAHYHFQPSRKTTRQMEIGTAIHTSLLEPERFAEEYMLLKDVKVRTASAYKDAKKVHAGDKLLTGPEADKVVGMKESVYAQPHARAVLETVGYREASIFTTDPDTGTPVKCRFDILTELGRVIDVKKTQDARPDAFSRSVFAYRYHAQAAFYSDVYFWATGDKLEAFGMLAIEEEIPHAAMLYVMDDETLNLGRQLYRNALNRYAECVESEQWPAYGDEPQLISLPSWAARKNEDEIEEGATDSE